MIVLLAAGLLAACGDSTPETKSAMPLHSPPASVPPFSGTHAFDLLERQVAFGPRVPGTDSHRECLQFFRAYFDSLGLPATLQTFEFPGYDDVTLPLTNVIVRIRPDVNRRILLAAHWDSRPTADRESDPDRALRPIPGANDGASGTAVLLEIAAVLARNPPPAGVDIVLFDGEDYGREGDESMFCLGAKYYAASRGPGDATPLFGILLDLVGDRDAVFPMEEFSRRYAPDILKLVWDEAARLGIRRFVSIPHSGIYDDHVPLNTVAGIKTIDIVDADLVGHAAEDPRRKYWHTLNDTPEQCAPETLADVGRVLLSIIYGISNA